MTYEGPSDTTSISEHFNLDLSFTDEQTLKNHYFKESIRILRNKEKFKNVIVLSGSAHPRNHFKLYEQMKIDVPHMSFIQAYGGGTEWNIQNNNRGVHKTRPFHKNLAIASDNASLVLMPPNEAPEMFDGVFIFKTVSASPPYFEQNIK